MAKESKLDASVFFLGGMPMKTFLGPCPAVVHLFEQGVGIGEDIWFGSLDVVATAGDVHEAARAAGLDSSPAGRMASPSSYKLRIETEDGRWGLATQRAGRWSSYQVNEFQPTPPPNSTLISFVGETTLTPKP